MLSNAVGAEVREVRDREWDGRPAKAVVATRLYETEPDDLWDALTNPQRLPRWFAPVTGDLELGGRFQIQGNAGGVVLACQPSQALDITWEFAGATSWVTLRLAAEGAGTRLTLEHIVAIADLDGEHWRKYGPAAVGVGWDLSFLGLGSHLAHQGGKPPESDPAWAASDEGKGFMRASAEAWGAAHIASGENPETARRMAATTASFYTGG